MNASMGMEVEVGETPMDPAGSPDDALLTTLRLGYAWLPAAGFEPPQVDGHWALHRYVVGDRVKAIAVSTDRFPSLVESDGWELVGLRACDPSEFDPADGLTENGTTIWLDAASKPVRADFLFSRPGPGHCGWERVTFLQLGDELYLRDVKGVLAGQTLRAFRIVRALPTGAVDTGFHTSALRLFTVPDRQSVYVKSSKGTIERWGRATEQIGCM